MRALVVTGGTEVDWDEIRSVTNRSQGVLGLMIARWLTTQKENFRALADVTVLGSERALAIPRFGGAPYKAVSFRTYDELVAKLDEYLAEGIPDFIFMPAAISDYAPVKVAGKVRSDAERVTVTFRKLPKILATLRERCGIKTFIVGFKLLHGVSEEELIRTALKQTREARINLTVANDADLLRWSGNKGKHPAFLVTPEGGAIRTNRTKNNVAKEIVEFSIRRHATTWARSEAIPLRTPREGAAYRQAANLLSFAQKTGLLHDQNGNVSARRGETGHLWITPRKADKTLLSPWDLIAATHHEENGENRVEYEAPEDHQGRKPSIDTMVHSLLYQTTTTQVSGLIHFHDGFVVPDVETGFPYPCGTREEYEEIYRGFRVRAPCIVELKHHGYLLCVEPGGGRRLLEGWEGIMEGWRAGLAGGFGEGLADLMADAKLSPLIVRGHLAGLVAETSTFVYPYIPSWVTPEGRSLALRLLSFEARTLAVPRAEADSFSNWKTIANLEGDVTLLVPEWAKQQDAAVGLLECDGKLLMLYRHLDDAAYPGALVFPGGRRDGGESMEEAVVREFKEETGLDVRVVRPHGLVTSFSKKTLTNHRMRAYQVEEIGGALRTFPTEEHREAAWFGPETPPKIGRATRILFERYWKDQQNA